MSNDVPDPERRRFLKLAGMAGLYLLLEACTPKIPTIIPTSTPVPAPTNTPVPSPTPTPQTTLQEYVLRDLVRHYPALEKQDMSILSTALSDHVPRMFKWISGWRYNPASTREGGAIAAYERDKDLLFQSLEYHFDLGKQSLLPLDNSINQIVGYKPEFALAYMVFHPWLYQIIWYGPDGNKITNQANPDRELAIENLRKVSRFGKIIDSSAREHDEAVEEFKRWNIRALQVYPKSTDFYERAVEMLLDSGNISSRYGIIIGGLATKGVRDTGSAIESRTHLSYLYGKSVGSLLGEVYADGPINPAFQDENQSFIITNQDRTLLEQSLNTTLLLAPGNQFHAYQRPREDNSKAFIYVLSEEGLFEKHYL